MFAATETLSPLAGGWFLDNAWLAPVVPTMGFALIVLFGKRLPKKGSEIGVLSLVASLVLAAGAAWQWIQRVNSAGEEQFVSPLVRTWTWWQSGGVEFTIGQHVDGLTVIVLFVVAFISTLVQVYSLEYLRGDRRYTHFFAALTLFSAGMLAMVVAEDMILFLLGWEIMGLCSFMLIGHWWEDGANSRAALKAFFTVRTGDVGLLVGIATLFFAANEWTTTNLGLSGFSIRGISAWALSGEPNSTVILVAAIALFIACIGKSGQFPLHTWLPDAMAGPTPVSSLLHSSTMVVAGVFLVARLYPVFFAGLDILGPSANVIMIIAAITIVIAAALAFVQSDIKRVLAYSTVSQLGYMMLGLGAGAWLPGGVPHLHSRVLQGVPLFVRRFGEPQRVAPLLRYEERHGRPAQAHARHLRGVDGVDARLVRSLPVLRILLKGRNHRQRRRQRLHVLHGRRIVRRVLDGGIHDSRHVPHVLWCAARRGGGRARGAWCT